MKTQSTDHESESQHKLIQNQGEIVMSKWRLWEK